MVSFPNRTLLMGGNTFQKINKKPFLVMDTSRITKIYYRDSVQNYKPYYYRVQGIDPFAEVSDYSDVVLGFGRIKHLREA